MLRKIMFFLVLPLFLVVFGVQPASSFVVSKTFNTFPIVNDEDCTVIPNVTVTFDDTSGYLEVTMTYNDTAITSPSQLFMGVLFDIFGDAVLTGPGDQPAVSAIVPASSFLVVPTSAGPTNVSENVAVKGKRPHPNGEGRFVRSIDAGYLGIFHYVIGMMGSINEGFANVTLGTGDIIDPMDDTQPNGTDYGLVPMNTPVHTLRPLSNPNFAIDGPYIQHEVTITFDIVGTLTDIGKVVPLFGTEGFAPDTDNDCVAPAAPLTESETETDGGGGGKALGRGKNK